MNIAIMGAGLSGLNCAKNLESLPNVNIDLFEKESSIGGRIKTDEVDGCLLDHGFQVFLPNYPEAKKAFAHKKLNLSAFKAGAKINGNYVGDPFREPQVLFSTLLSPIGSIKDKLLILKLRYEKAVPSDGQTALHFLKNYGFSKKVINNFFRPFFSGVFLNKELENDANFFLFLYQMFSSGYATLPKNGMKELPQNIERQLTKTNIHLQTPVNIINHQSIQMPTGDVKKYDFIITAHPDEHTSFYCVTTDYFWISRDSNHDFSNALELFTGQKFINHIAAVSLANPHYSPGDKILLSVNSLNTSTVQDVSNELKSIYPELEFNFIKRYEIKKALPKTTKNLQNESKFIRCGDFLETPSINGALASGRKAAQKILEVISQQ